MHNRFKLQLSRILYNRSLCCSTFALVGLLIPVSALAQSAPEPLYFPPISSSATLSDTDTAQTAPVVPEPVSEPEPTPEEVNTESEFGTRGDDRWYIQGGAATHIDNQESGQFGMAGVGISHFFIDRHSINGELNSFYFSQTGEDAAGLNLAVLIRSHLYQQPTWSLYIDGGAGIIGTTSEVPSDGSQFNFTPQAGIGATINLDNDRRLMVGVRWHHISNANLYEANPGRDSVMGYVGVNLPR